MGGYSALSTGRLPLLLNLRSLRRQHWPAHPTCSTGTAANSVCSRLLGAIDFAWGPASSQPLHWSSRRRHHTMVDTPNPTLLTREGVRVAIEGCGHGALNPIYSAVTAACEARNWPGVDLLIICGDFQATRNGTDVEVMSVPAKYRVLGDFHEYYSGAKTAPYLTIFIGGNHEAAAYLAELYYGGWVAPNIYYMGAANILRVGPLRIAGLSGIWKGHDYNKPHRERLPLGKGDIKSFYHVREYDVRKLLQVRGQVDVGLSHDWPRGVEYHGDVEKLFKLRPMWKEESLSGKLGSRAAEYVMDRLRPAYWFSAHMHWKFAAIKTYPPPGQDAVVGGQLDGAKEEGQSAKTEEPPSAALQTEPEPAVEDPNEINLDMDDEDDAAAPADNGKNEVKVTESGPEQPSTAVSDDLRAQLPAAFAPKPKPPPGIPGQPVPPTITNTEVRFLALNKCEPRRTFLQVCDLHPVNPDDYDIYPPSPNATNPNTRYPLQYDPEWLAISRVFHPLLVIGDRDHTVPTNEGEEAYRPRIEAERAWVEENIVAKGKLAVPHNFVQTAPALTEDADPALRDLHRGVQPHEYTNSQTSAFCELLGVSNLWDATEEEREERRKTGPPPDEFNDDFRGGHGGGRGRGRGGFGGGRGRGRGGWRGGFNRGGRGGRGRGW